MPWSPERYPPAMQHLPPEVRAKAVEIANAVLAQDGDEGKAIRVGIARQGFGAAPPRCRETAPSRAGRLGLTLTPR